MDFSQIKLAALSVRDKYNQLNRQNVGHVWTNREVMEGMVGDVGDLMKFIMAKEGSRADKTDLDDNIQHEICDILWCLINLSDRYGFDLEKVFLKKMDELAARVDEEINR